MLFIATKHMDHVLEEEVTYALVLIARKIIVMVAFTVISATDYISRISKRGHLSSDQETECSLR